MCLKVLVPLITLCKVSAISEGRNQSSPGVLRNTDSAMFRISFGSKFFDL